MVAFFKTAADSVAGQRAKLAELDAAGLRELSFVVDGLEHSGSKGIF